MRVGFFSDSYFPEIDGVSYTLKSWRDRLEERGHEVYIIYPDSDRYEPGEREIPVPSLPNPFYSGYNVPFPVNTGRFPEVDVVHCHSPFNLGRVGRYYARIRDLPTVYTHHTPVEEYFEQATRSEAMAKMIEKLYLPLENRFMRKFDTVTSSTSRINRDVETVQLPVGLDMRFFEPRDGSFVDELEGPVAGYSGRISMEKNVEKLLEFAGGFDGTVMIVGEGPRKEALVRKAPDNVVFRDFLDREKLPEFYSGIDVFVTASTGDTLGLSTLEANSCGTPVAAPDVPPFDETIQGENGLRYDLDDMEDMREKIRGCLKGEFSTREAVRGYSLEKTIDGLEEIYTAITG
ncbi:MAG: glycosyltransferase [Candidatus Nanohaloarchaea archaeon]